MKDAAQKEALYRHFRCQGWYALVEVPVYHRAGSFGNQKIITDIDVLGFCPTPDLRWQVILGDCKTKKSESPANRAIWLSGLMQHASADRGVIVLKKDRVSVEPDHRLFANSLNITLIEEKDFDTYDRSVVYPSGSRHHPESADSLQRLRNDLMYRYPSLSKYCQYLTTKAWNESDHFVLLRNSIAAARQIHDELDPSKPHHLALVLEGASVFAVALATCIGAVFRQFLKVTDRTVLDDALRVIIWGGYDNYTYISSIRKQLVLIKGGVSEDSDTLALPEWNSFLQLVRNHLESPHFTFQEPDVLRMAALDILDGHPFLKRIQHDPMVVKLSMLTALYYVRAARFPAETAVRIQDLFVERMSNIS